PTAFDSVRAALRYTYKRSGIEQDVILYQRLASPSDYGCSPASSVLEMWTEFLTAPAPGITPNETTGDQVLDFGETRLGRGKAYLQNDQEIQSIALSKTCTNIEGRGFLIESVRYSAL